MEYVSTEQIPADDLLDQAISALELVDISELSRLAAGASSVAMPESQLRYRRNREVFTALLDATGRNLRLLRRATGRKPSEFYKPA